MPNSWPFASTPTETGLSFEMLDPSWPKNKLCLAARAVGHSEIIVAVLAEEVAFADDCLDAHQSTRTRPLSPSYAQALSS